jgi:PAS domain S-box-containing protein
MIGLDLLMPPEFSQSKHLWTGTFKSLAVGLCVFLIGRELAIWLTVRNIHGSLAILDNVLAGIAAALVVFLSEYRRQRTATELRESERRFRLVANAAPVMIWMAGTDKLCIYCNKPWLEFTGRSIEQELGNGWTEGIHPEDSQGCLDTYTKSFDLREEFKMEYRLRRHDGEYRWIFDTGVPRYREDGSFAGYIGSRVDVTERKQAEEARLRYAAVIESSEDAIISKNLDGMIVSWNAGAERLFGYAEVEAVGQPITILIPPDLWDEESKILERLRGGGRIEHYETTRVAKSGKRIDVSLTIGPIRGSNGSVVGFSKIAHNITKRKHAERTLIESEERLLLAARVARMFAYSWDATTDSLQRSGESAEILGIHSNAANTGAAVSAMVHPADRERLESALAKLTVENPILQISYRIVRPNGGIAWLERNSRAYFDEQGRLTRIIGMIRDITEDKKHEEALRASEEKFRSVFLEAGIGMVIVSPEGRFLAANQAFCDCLGYTEQELLDMTVESVTFPDDWRIFAEKLSGALLERRGFQWLQKRCLHKSGRIVYTETSTSVIRNADGEPLFLVGQVLDITGRRKAEEALSDMTRKLIDAQEQERARIARELHDDINQRLALLAVQLDQLRSTPSDVRNRVDDLQKQTIEISDDIQTLSHQLHSSKLEYLGAIPAMKGLCREVAERQKMEVTFKTDVSSLLPTEIGLSLFRILQEALHNAAKYSGAKQVAVELAELSNEVHLVVSDSGKGFDVEAALQGEGLGLTSMRERIRLVNGRFTIESKPMRGTEIHVYVPHHSQQHSERMAG